MQLDPRPLLLRDRLAHGFTATSRARGEQYFEDGRVDIVAADADEVFARVDGTYEYDVLLVVQGTTREATRLGVYCTCPLFDRDGEPCKHLWATLLAMEEERPTALSAIPPQGRVVLDDVEDDTHIDRLLGFEPLDALEPFDPRAAARDALAPSRSLPQPSRALPSPTPRPRPDWRGTSLLARTSAAIPAALDRRHRRELSYALDLPRSKEAGTLLVDVRERTVGPTTRSVAWKPAIVMHQEVRSLADPLDREILGLLVPRSSSPDLHLAAWYGAMGRVGGGGAGYEAPLTGAWDRLVLPLARSGRCEVTWAEGVPPRALEVDEGGRFEVVLVARAERGGLALEGELRRGEEIVPLAAPGLILASGVAFVESRALEIATDVPFAWISLFRAHGRVAVSDDERRDLLRALVTTCPARALDLPDIAIDDASVPLVVNLRLRTPRQNAYAKSSAPFDVEIAFVYGGARASLFDGGDAALDTERGRLVRRDRAAEAAALEELAAVGFQLVGGRGDPGRLTLAASRLVSAVDALPPERFVIEADGLVVKRASSMSFSVSSGIDWFDLDARADFDGVVAPMPAILEAVRRGDRMVRLGDGTLGVLPEEWLARVERVMALGTARDALRFGRSQIALVEAMLADDRTEIAWDGPLASLKQRLSSFVSGGLARAKTPRGFLASLRPYQAEGVTWMAGLEDLGLSGCLADDMGLGKTVQVLAHLLGRKRARRSAGPSLVVAPRSVVYNWIEEARRFAPELRVVEHERGGSLEGVDLAVTSYGVLRLDVARLAREELDYVVLDEAHAIKNPAAATTKAAGLLRARHRLALTGTPVENHLGELATLFDFLNPGMLGPSVRKAVQGGRRSDAEAAARLGRGLRPFLLRRRKSDVLVDLPPRIEQTIRCVLGRKQRAVYDDLREHYRTTLLARIRKQGVAKNTVHVLEALLRLRQVACHPGLVDRSSARDESAKLDTLLEHLQPIVEQGKKTLVFSQFTTLLDLVGEELAERDIAFERLDGATRDRKARVERFQKDGACHVFLVSLKAGGVGLNLTAAEYVFLLDPWWNPAAEAQAIDRAHRIGQTNTVVAYRLLCKDTIEERVEDLQRRKKDLVSSFFADDGQTSIGALSVEDVEALLS